MLPTRTRRDRRAADHEPETPETAMGGPAARIAYRLVSDVDAVVQYSSSRRAQAAALTWKRASRRSSPQALAEDDEKERGLILLLLGEGVASARWSSVRSLLSLTNRSSNVAVGDVPSSGDETAYRGSRPGLDLRSGHWIRGSSGERNVGRPFFVDGPLSPVFSVAAPATDPVALRARMRRCRLPTVLSCRRCCRRRERG